MSLVQTVNFCPLIYNIKVTIGFGDYCPTLEGPSSPTSSDSYGWILFIFVGLILSTLTVDMVGSSYIERMLYAWISSTV
jgi:hypothetical protein